jgi:uncharacterized membrane protein
MLPDPLHPAVVHLPIALAVLMPLIAAGAIAAIARGFLPTRAWWAAVALQVALVGSAWLALETGEADEDRVERVVAERYLDAHEEAAEWFLAVSGAAAVLMAVGLLAGRTGRIGRVAGALGSLVVLATAVRVGHLGGELVYRHGAANAYAESSQPAPDPETRASP